MVVSPECDAALTAVEGAGLLAKVLWLFFRGAALALGVRARDSSDWRGAAAAACLGAVKYNRT